MTTGQPSTNLRAIHGYLLLLIFAGTRFIPALNQGWPWGLLAPLIGYFIVALSVPTLRRSLVWLRLGRATPGSLAFTLLLMVVTILVLAAVVRPHDTGHRDFLPFEKSCGLVAAGVLFSVCNALREEFFFRGILFDSLDSLWGKGMAIALSAIIFGLAHLHGVPSGVRGVCLAGIYGLALGGLRVWTGGLLLPIIAHISADSMIFYSLAEAGHP
jgi:membrane protease YdiL (CAAX protease family)